jgi:hypothetical protein
VYPYMSAPCVPKLNGTGWTVQRKGALLLGSIGVSAVQRFVKRFFDRRQRGHVARVRFLANFGRKFLVRRNSRRMMARSSAWSGRSKAAFNVPIRLDRGHDGGDCCRMWAFLLARLANAVD